MLLSKQSKIGRPVAPIQANNSVTRNKLFDYFIDGLKILNQRKIDTNEEQIANHFGLEPIQVKTWLEKASSLGKVEKVRDKSQTLWKTK